MTCPHDCSRSTSSQYDRVRKLLVYFNRCDTCGARLEDVHTVEYRPEDLVPQGNDRFLRWPLVKWVR